MATLPTNPSSAFMARNPHIYGQKAVNVADYQPAAKAKSAKRIRQSEKPLMNKLESEFFLWLNSQRIPKHHPQSFTLRLGNGLRYTPDFYSPTGATAYEVKGPWATDDSIAKLKISATTYPEITFTLVWKDVNEQWQFQVVRP